ncbi:HpcH/HpaI aldolase/citrate lyase family protein [Peterkaempfera bronchialis]|uniref:CoA ester lyase n=1 Tax=Peterkaempfera bronchialis TaxID=2126346 RepID=A0A345STA8_9ACTN|nr:CoA ester lyase [Peterkaempfera bronchialis]AXI76963.1 CoA ester lyase [Peterkaempfera bronchialis]
MSASSPDWPGTAWLITPATAGPHRFDAALRSGADVWLLDLEDSVPPDSKESARRAALAFLAGPSASGAPQVGLRLNAPGTLAGMEDLVALARAGAGGHLLLIPKVESARDVTLVADVLAGGVRLWALIESPRAVQRLPQILEVAPLDGVVFGAADYAAAAGRPLGSAALDWVRAAVAQAASAAGIPAIDSPCFDLADPTTLQAEAEFARDLGYCGKGAVHPDQIEAIRAAFAPTDAQLAKARQVVTAAQSADGGITTVDGRMIGPPLVEAARALTARHSDPSGGTR